MTVPTQHPDSLPPLIRNVSIIGQSPSVDGPPDAGVGNPDCIDHPRVEEDQQEDWNQVK